MKTTVFQPEEIELCIKLVRNHLEETEGRELHSFAPEGVPSIVALPKGVKNTLKSIRDTHFISSLDIPVVMSRPVVGETHSVHE